MSSISRWRNWPELTLALVLVLMYLPALVLTYGLKDDYTYLAAAHGYAGAGAGEPGFSIRMGRPLFGVLTAGLDAVLPGVGFLGVARGLSVAGLIFFGIVLHRALVPLVRARSSAVLVVLFICSMPPFLVYAGWATLFCAPYSAALAALGALSAARASDASARERMRWLVLGNVLLLTALAMYQPTAMAFWPVALILALGRRHSPERLSGLLRQVALVAAPPMLGAYLMLKIGVWALGAASAQRSGLLSDLPGKLHWVPEPLGLSLNLFNMPQSTVVAVVIAGAVVAGALLFSSDCEGRARALILLLAAVAVPLSIAPNLLSQENYATFRVVGSLTATFALLTALFFVAFERNGTQTWQTLVGRGGLLLITAVSVALGFNHLRTLIALPQSREWRLVLSQAARLPAHPSSVGFLAPTVGEGPITTRYGVRDEFGVPTSASTWADPALTWLAARQTGRVSAPRLKVLVSVGGRGDLPAGVPLIDMRDLRRLR